MAYEKQTWNTGDIITADKLNHMEDGIGSGGGGSDSNSLIVTVTHNEENHLVGDHTLEEIIEAIDAGKYVQLRKLRDNRGNADIYNLLSYNHPEQGNIYAGEVEFYRLSWVADDDGTNFGIDVMGLNQSSTYWEGDYGFATYFSN